MLIQLNNKGGYMRVNYLIYKYLIYAIIIIKLK